MRKQREQELLMHSEQLTGALKQKTREFGGQYEKYLEHLLLYQIEVSHFPFRTNDSGVSSANGMQNENDMKTIASN